MSQWQDLYGYFSSKLNEWRALIDVEEHDGEIRTAEKVVREIELSRAEKSLQRMAQSVDAVLAEEIIRAPSGKAFVPQHYIVFLNAADDAEWTGKKRDFLRQELSQIIFAEAERRAGQNDLVVSTIEIDFRVDGTLDAEELRVTAQYDEGREMTVVTNREKTVILGKQPSFTPVFEPDKATNFAAPLYNVDVSENGVRVALIPVYKREAVIGRGTGDLSVEIPLNKAAVSRRHAVLEINEDNQFWITHVGANPTIVDGVELEQNSRTSFSPQSAIEICGFTIQTIFNER